MSVMVSKSYSHCKVMVRTTSNKIFRQCNPPSDNSAETNNRGATDESLSSSACN